MLTQGSHCLAPNKPKDFPGHQKDPVVVPSNL